MSGSDAALGRLPWSGDGSTGSALVLPGRNGGVFQAHLYWSVVALVDAGWEVHVADWGTRGDEDDVARIANRWLEGRQPGSGSVVLGKSWGTLAATEVAWAGIPAVWFTPLMDRLDVAGAVQTSRVPTLVVGGMADPTWRRPEDRHGLLVIEIEDAAHSLLIPGDWARSLAELQRVVHEAVRFCESVARGGG